MSRLTIVVGAVVTVAWLANVTVQLATQGAYTTPLEIHGLMGTVVGALYTHERLRRRNGDDG